MIFATAGHVDHGKTSLVKALTGVDTDRLAEEKARGLTIDLGFAYVHQNQQSIGFVDVPGHAKFISNMLAGVAAIDHALLVIAADDGPMPQTSEHVAILELLGIECATIVITKIDRVGPEDLAISRQSIQTLLATTLYVGSPIFEVSSTDGTGLEALKQHLWQLKSGRAESSQQYFRLAIDRRFSVKGSGLVVTGSVISGTVKVTDELRLMPSNTKVRVRTLHRQDTDATRANTGDRCALNLTGDVDIERVSRGQWITNHPELPVSTRLDAKLRLLTSELTPLKTGLPVHIHLGAQHTTGRVFLLELRQLNPGDSALCQIVSDAPISACYGDRFVVRDQSASRTVAGGWIVDPHSVQRGRSKPLRLEILNKMSGKDPVSHLDQLISTAKGGINLTKLMYGLNQTSVESSYPTDESGLSHHQNHVAEFQKKILTLLKTSSLAQRDLRLSLEIKESFFKLILGQLIKTGKVEIDSTHVSLVGRSAGLSKPAEALWKKVEPILEKGSLQPPVIHELAKQVNLPTAALEKLLAECIKHGIVVRPIKNRYFLPRSLQHLRTQVAEVAAAAGGEFTVIQFRDQSKIGRNLCIELLEFLDSKGFTKRLGDKRIVQDMNR
ncbi:MAG: selenocysteine-specific elongation factor [Patiriisocius sp.]